MQFNHINSGDPVARARNVEGIIEVLREHCLAEADKVLDPEVKSLFERTSSALEELSHEYQLYLNKEKIPWERYEESFPQKSSDPWD